jgi:hypothetical protein
LGDVALDFDARVAFPAIFKLVQNDVESRKARTELAFVECYYGPARRRAAEELKVESKGMWLLEVREGGGKMDPGCSEDTGRDVAAVGDWKEK